jgi:DMSO/TMAO reductase YedYZ molybdopterin-dependent catalytic subunit
MPRIRRPIPSIPDVDPDLLVKDATKLMPDPTRRAFLRGGLSVGALTMLTGCTVSDGFSAERVLRKISEFNDSVQAWLFDPNRLAQTYPESAIKRPFRFNAYYPESDIPEVDGEDYKLEVTGLVANKETWTLQALNALPQETQITRLICVEGWSEIGKWTGVPLGQFLRRVGADLTAKYVWFRCAEGYHSSIDMPSALHPQTQMTLQFDGKELEPKYGYPMRIRIPTKLGFKNPKHVMEIAVINNYNPGYWETQGYNWFSGL